MKYIKLFENYPYSSGGWQEIYPEEAENREESIEFVRNLMKNKDSILSKFKDVIWVDGETREIQDKADELMNNTIVVGEIDGTMYYVYEYKPDGNQLTLF